MAAPAGGSALEQALAALEQQVQAVTSKQAGQADPAQPPKGAARRLQLLAEIERRLQLEERAHIEEAQPTVERILGATLPVATGPILRRQLARCYAVLYERGARASMYAVTGNLLNQLGAKGAAAAASAPPPVARAAMAHVLGAVCEAHGHAMASIVREAVLCLLKLVKAASAPADAPLRLAALEALRGALAGAGPREIGPAAQADALKILRAAAAAAVPVGAGAAPAPAVKGGGGAFGADEASRCAAARGRLRARARASPPATPRAVRPT